MKLWELNPPVVQQLWVQIFTTLQACDVPISPEFKDPVGLTFKTASLSQVPSLQGFPVVVPHTLSPYTV